MSAFLDDCDAHAALETFDPAVFVPAEDVSQAACAFVLTLAAIFNDAKDIGYALTFLEENQPEGPAERTRCWGQCCGLDLHLYRTLFGLLHELFKLIYDNREVLSEPVMKKTIGQLSPQAKLSWQRLVDVAHDKKLKEPLTRSMALARHKIAFHYDSEQIMRGYAKHFVGEGAMDERAYLSRGPNMRTSRFYFADAALQGYIHNVATTDGWNELVRHANQIFDSLNHAAMGIVRGFILVRGGAFRGYSEGNA